MFMTGETDLHILITSMKPSLHAQPFVFCSIDNATFDQLPFIPLGTFCEDEGISIIVTQQQADDNSLIYEGVWACITLEIHSALSAVGFLAVITHRLSRTGISVNPVSAFYHDHLFVPWNMRDIAVEELDELSSTR